MKLSDFKGPNISAAQRHKLAYLQLAGAIVFEVAGTTFLKMSVGFTVIPFDIALLVSYGLSFLCLTFALRELPVGVTYGIWGGAGTVAAAIIGVIAWSDPFGWQTVVGAILIMVGIALITRNSSEDSPTNDNLS